jgi:hypothetical protein
LYCLPVKFLWGIVVFGLLVGCAGRNSPEEEAAAAVNEARAAVASATPTEDLALTTVSVPPQPDVLVKNALYRGGPLSPAGCRMPGYSMTSLATVRDFYTDLLRCFNKSWEPAIRAAGFTFQAPKLVVTKGRPTSAPCTYPDGPAFYCDRTIYMDAKADLSVRGVPSDVVKVWMAFAFGHEYAHHLQALTGILAAKYQRGPTLNGVDAALEESRRLELQATCLSGVYFGAERTSIPVTAGWRSAYQWVVSSGEDRSKDHGSKESRKRWATVGLDTADPSGCNTYSVDSAQVS